MQDYDSDSSLSDAESGISTNVLLGYASKEPTDDPFSQLGGQPSWLDPTQHAPPHLAKCKSCSGYMTLLLQLNGDLPARFPGHERRLYIWACRKKACRRKDGSIRAVRGVRISKQAAAHPEGARASSKAPIDVPAERQDIGSALFGAKPSSTSTNMNPFSPNSSSIANSFSSASAQLSTLAAKPPQRPSATQSISQPVDDLPETFAQKARISAPSSIPSVHTSTVVNEPWPSSSILPKPFPSYHLDADYEYLSNPSGATNGSSSSSSAAAAAKIDKYTAFMDLDGEDADDPDAEQPSTSKKATASAASPKQKSRDSPSSADTAADEESPHDKAFLHFADALAQNPEQILRYEFAGAPLLYSRTDTVGRLLAAHHHHHTAAAAGNAKVTTIAAAVGSSGAGMPRCGRCGAARAFELQLTPHAIAELEAEEEAATLLGEGMEWGTVMLGVCSADCAGDDRGIGDDAESSGGKVRYLEEWVGVQWEEVVESRGGGRRKR